MNPDFFMILYIQQMVEIKQRKGTIKYEDIIREAQRSQSIGITDNGHRITIAFYDCSDVWRIIRTFFYRCYTYSFWT